MRWRACSNNWGGGSQKKDIYILKTTGLPILRRPSLCRRTLCSYNQWPQGFGVMQGTKNPRWIVTHRSIRALSHHATNQYGGQIRPRKTKFEPFHPFLGKAAEHHDEDEAKDSSQGSYESSVTITDSNITQLFEDQNFAEGLFDNYDQRATKLPKDGEF